MALDPTCDVLLAYRANGEFLHPYHGFPLSLIIPGWSGLALIAIAGPSPGSGRNVKWLTSIRVSSEQIDNYYHFFDNRILPPHVDEELAQAEGPPPLIFARSSVIWSPAPGEVLSLQRTHPITIGGYALSGGGRAVTRVEVSLDGCKTWILSTIERFERPSADGRSWCWVFWRLAVDAARLDSAAVEGAHEIACRAWDEANNTQGKNAIYRLRLSRAANAAGERAVLVEHPVVAGHPTGWMRPADGDASAAAKKEPASAPAPAAQEKPAPAPQKSSAVNVAPNAQVVLPAGGSAHTLTMDEVAKHNTMDDCWIVVSNKVYDCTPYLNEHPGGGHSIVMKVQSPSPAFVPPPALALPTRAPRDRQAGTDSTKEFEETHSKGAYKLLADWCASKKIAAGHAYASACTKWGAPLAMDVRYIGELGGAFVANPRCPGRPFWLRPDAPNALGRRRSVIDVPEGAPVSLKDGRGPITVTLLEREVLSNDGRRYRFGLKTPEHVLGLRVGWHLSLSAPIGPGGAHVSRIYTPITGNEVRGYFDLAVRVPSSPPLVGDTILVKGASGDIVYRGRGEFEIEGRHLHLDRVGLVAGGTGIAPMFAMIKAILADPEDKTEAWLLYAPRSPDKILLKAELDELCAKHPGRLRVWHTVDKVGEGEAGAWTFSQGPVSETMFRERLPAPGAGSGVFMCGPPGMPKQTCVPNLERVGYPSDLLFAF
eukprot:tig00021582_g22634.t1